jgi:hypothetical protein
LTRAMWTAQIGAALLLMAPHANADSFVPRPACRLRLQVWLDPDVPDPRNEGFLSSLANRPGYALTWLGASQDDKSVTLELSGPGPSYQCRRELDFIRRDARVLTVKVLSRRDS